MEGLARSALLVRLLYPGGLIPAMKTSFCSFLLNFVSFGPLTSFGVYQEEVGNRGTVSQDALLIMASIHSTNCESSLLPLPL